MAELVILLIVIATALAFDFTNGFHDTGNAMATSIATGALKPKTAVTLSAVCNLIGAFLSIEVAKTVSKVVRIQDADGVPIPGLSGHTLIIIVFAGLTAWDTQRIKEMYFEGDDQLTAGRKAVMGALSLYLDFINLFMMLLQLFGARRD